MSKRFQLRSALVCALLMTPAFAAAVAAQVYSLTPAGLARYSPQNPYERFPDGRPKVPDKLVDTVKYKSGEIYGRPRDPELLKEFEEFIKQKGAKKEKEK